MKRMSCLLAFCLAMVFLTGCATKPDGLPAEPSAGPGPDRAVKIRVADVSNDTKELFDVDVIGLLWNAVDESLLKRGMLWTGESSTAPLTLEIHIEKYRKGNAIARCLPYVGNTELSVKCDLKSGDNLIGSVATKHTINLRRGGLSAGAWKQVFKDVGEDMVTQIASRI